VRAVLTAIWFAICVAICSASQDDESTISYAVWHGFSNARGNVSFVPRNNVLLDFASTPPTVAFRPNVAALSDSHLRDLQDAIARDGRYYVRLRGPLPQSSSSSTAVPESAELGPVIQTSIPACLLVLSSYAEKLNFEVDILGRVVAMYSDDMALPLFTRETSHEQQLESYVSVCPDPKGREMKQALDTLLRKGASIHSKAKISFGKVGEKPRLLRSATAPREGAGAEEDNRSFFQKYWMYIVPAALVVLLQMFMNPPQQQGGSQQ